MRITCAAVAAVGMAALLCATAQAAPGMEGAPGGQPPMAKFTNVSKLVQDKCMACHTRGYDLPFYAKVPGIRQIIEKDYRDGIRAMDLNVELVQNSGKPIGETVLAKMEWVVLNDTMPPPSSRLCIGAVGFRIRTKKTSFPG